MVKSLVLLCASIAAFKYDYVTCGSLIKLYSPQFDIRLHSHEVSYGTGSGQQSVTGVSFSDDANSYWQVRGLSSKPCKRGEPIACGSSVRFTHVNTRKNLHSHGFQSPLTSQQEVSAFGENGEGDDLDNWTVQCNGKEWDRKSYVSIYHPETKKYLAPSGREFNRPISGQMEIVASRQNSKWKVMEGVYIKPTEEEEPMHDEL